MFSFEWVPFTGGVVRLIAGLTGVGAAALMAPVLLIGFGLDLITVVAKDLLFVMITKLAVIRVHQKNQFVDWWITPRM